MATRRPIARLKITINGHTLTGEKWPSGWLLACEFWSDLEDAWAGRDDVTPAIDEFIRRATAASPGHTPPPPLANGWDDFKDK